GLQTYGPVISARIQPLDLANGSGREALIAICEEFNVRNARGRNLYISCDLGGKTPSRTGDYPFKADFENINGVTISAVSSTASPRAIVGIRNCRGSVEPGIHIEAHAPGDYAIF